MNTRPTKGKAQRRNGNKKSGLNVNLDRVEPLTDNQKTVFESDNHVVLNGCAGTGKTFITTYLALDLILNKNEFAKLAYIRSAVPTRDIGFLPGKESEKMEVYERPYADIISELCNRGDAYEVLKQKEIVKFIPTSFLRGTTLRDTVVIVDECQNMSFHELDSIITRIGDNCQVYLCGDYFQSDLKDNGLKKFHRVLEQMKSFDFVEFSLDDIVRSDFVKEYLIAKYDVHGTAQVD